jgi:hypothetical protein
MKMNFKETALLLGMSMAVPATSIAQDKVEASLKEMVGSMTGKTNDHTASKNAATIHKEDAK